MMMMVFWPHICNCLAYMASLAKKYFWSNVLNRSLFIAEGGTYAKMIYVEKIILCDVFQKWSKKFKFSRNRKHHEKRLKKTLVVMFSDFWLLTIFKSPLKNITNYIFFVHTILNITWIFTLFWQCFVLYVYCNTQTYHQNKNYCQTKLEKRMLCQILKFQLRNTLKLSPKEEN